MERPICFGKVLNAERFEVFLKDNMKGYYDLEACWNDFEDNLDNGTTHYELKGFETKSGNPECISYRVDYKYHMIDGRVVEYNEKSKEVPSDLDDFDYVERIVEL